MRCGHGDDGIHRVGLIIGHGQDCPSNNSAHRVTYQYDRHWVWQIGISSSSVGVMVQRQYVGQRVVDVFCLVEDGLSMESSHVFIKVCHEEIQAPGTDLDAVLVMLQYIMKVQGGFGSKRPALSVASCVSREEENRNSFELEERNPC